MSDLLQPRNVIVIGEQPLADELAERCRVADWATGLFLIEERSQRDGWEDRVRVAAQSARVAIEVMSESLEAKLEILAALDEALPEDALVLSSAFATTTTQVSQRSAHPQRVVGFAVLPPVSDQRVVELAAGLHTDVAYLNHAQAFFGAIHLSTAIVSDSAGLVSARIVCNLINEAAFALAEGVSDAAGIDAAMKLGTRYPFGPLEWGDRMGLDVVLSVMQNLQREWGSSYQPAPLLRQYVRAGWLGRKSGRGFYTYGA
jgi:3-hydroxybutyryl-CoA dehydrogenase